MEKNQMAEPKLENKAYTVQQYLNSKFFGMVSTGLLQALGLEL